MAFPDPAAPDSGDGADFVAIGHRLFRVLGVAGAVLLMGCEGDSTPPDNPVPVIEQLSPAAFAVGSSALELRVSGTGFMAGSVVLVDGEERTTEPAAGVGLLATLSAQDLSTAGEREVSVVNPEPGGGSSNGLPFTVVAIEPTLVAGASHTCGLTSTGAAFCWGAGWSGVLGTGEADSSPVPVAVTGGHTFATLAAGYGHACGVTLSGSVYCWGAASRGQLGTSVGHYSLVPVAVDGDHRFVKITAGDQHTCGLTAEGQAWCWGDNVAGQLGNGGRAAPTGPVAVAGGRAYQDIAAGRFHTCGITEGGAAYCWGRGQEGQLGNGVEILESDTSVRVEGDNAFVAIEAGEDYTCGLDADGFAYCWGANTRGQLGTGGTASSSIPVRVAGDGGYVALASGRSHSCALTAAGDAFCWGDGRSGQLGIGATPMHSAIPVPVTGGHVFARIAAGGHTCGLDVDGTPFCWGSGTYGQIGDGNALREVTVPVEVLPYP